MNDVTARMPVFVTDTNRYHRKGGMDRGEKLVAAASRAAVMTDFQDIRAKLRVTGEQPILFGALGITNKQKAHHPVSYQRDCAGEVRILQPYGPDGIGRQE
jgi:hypothetical protein